MADIVSPIPGETYRDHLADIERGPRRSFLTFLRLLLAGQWKGAA